ncbi:TAXI family TRAP transporter solute-binding subunit [Dechloromonas sp. ZY10]|uniref:TAXI family TRAP transporter solute-binding subunit n=1 Tax=Dechloromonas aquae TaxID=2664436 RepID=UPI003528DC9D
MMAKLKASLLSLRDLFATAWWIFLIAGIGFAVAYQFVEPAPPTRIVISTGGSSGAYYQFANRYAALLEKNGITLEVRTSAGSLENLERLKNDEAQVAFVQGGVMSVPSDPDAVEESGLLSLGSLFYEPVWVFYRGERFARPLSRLAELRGKRVAIGPEGSGVRQLATQLLAASEIPQGELLVPLTGQKAADELVAGRLDAVFVIAAEKAPVVQTLLRSEGIRAMGFAQADAYLRRFPFLSKLTLPQGVVDLVRDLPAQDVTLLAATANLVVRDDLHPALQSLLLQAAAEVHGKSGFFNRHGEFPAYKDQGLPLSAEAAHFFKSGPPFLQRYLPFWLAVLIDRLMVMLLPLIALLIPLLKVAPAIYTWRIRSKVFRCYGELRFLEEDLRQHFDPTRLGEYRQRLDALDEEASSLRVPLGFTDLVYTLREHVNLVRGMLLKREAQA